MQSDRLSIQRSIFDLSRIKLTFERFGIRANILHQIHPDGNWVIRVGHTMAMLLSVRVLPGHRASGLAPESNIAYNAGGGTHDR